MLQIGYQGIEFSNAQEAAKKMAASLFLETVELVPLVNSAGVVDAMRRGEVRYGVMATHNSVAGLVKETEDALATVTWSAVTSLDLRIHHCLFLKDAESTLDVVSMVASHIQALEQCKKSLQSLLPGREKQAVEDTAIAARHLRDGVLPATAAVLCRKEAGLAHGLCLAAENIEDSDNNITSFSMIRLNP